MSQFKRGSTDAVAARRRLLSHLVGRAEGEEMSAADKCWGVCSSWIIPIHQPPLLRTHLWIFGGRWEGVGRFSLKQDLQELKITLSDAQSNCAWASNAVLGSLIFHEMGGHRENDAYIFNHPTDLMDKNNL